MAITVQIIAAVLALCGLAGFINGLDLLPTERGIAFTISSVVAIGAGIITSALALLIRRLDRLSDQLRSGLPQVPVVAEVAPPAPQHAASDEQAELPLALPPANVSPPMVEMPAPVLELPPAPLPASVAPAAPEPAQPPFEAEIPVVAPILPAEPTPPSEAVPAAEPKRGRFKLPAFRRGAKVAAGTAATAAVASAAAAMAAAQEAADKAALAESAPGGTGSGEGGAGTSGELPESTEPAPDVAAAPVEAEASAAHPPHPEPVAPEPEAAAAAKPDPGLATQRPRIDFAPLPEDQRRRTPEPPLAPPRPPKPAPPAEPAQADNPYDALEAEFDRLIPLKNPARAEPPELPANTATDVDRPDEALEFALSAEPLLSDGTRPEAPPPTPPGRSPLRGDLSGPIELEERELTPPGIEVIGSYESGGARYTMYSDGSVIVEIDGKTLKFHSLEQLRDYIEAGSAKT